MKISYTLIDIFLNSYIVLGFSVLACLYTQRSGVFNLVIGSMVINSSFAFTLAVTKEYGELSAFSLALTTGLVTAILYGLLCIILDFEQIVCGIAFNLLSLGVVKWLMMYIVGSQQLVPTGGLGSSLTMRTRLLFILLMMMISCATYYVLEKSKYAPRLSAIGEDATASWLCDLPVKKYQFYSIVVSGILASIAGAFLSKNIGVFDLRQRHVFVVGFIALALVVASGGRLILSMLAAFIYSIVDSLLREQITGVPPQISEALPYLLIIGWFCLVGYAQRSPPTRLLRIFAPLRKGS